MLINETSPSVSASPGRCGSDGVGQEVVPSNLGVPPRCPHGAIVNVEACDDPPWCFVRVTDA